MWSVRAVGRTNQHKPRLFGGRAGILGDDMTHKLDTVEGELLINGPWKIQPPFGGEHPEIRDKDGRRIGIVTTSYPKMKENEDIKAALMCAAPELYVALRDLASRLRHDGDAHAWFMDEQIAAIKALSKARGE